MNYDTVIIGSGYFSAGYALSHKNTLVIEETQLLDPNFCGRLLGFDMKCKRPTERDGGALFDAFEAEGIMGDGKLAVNELEPAFCRFLEGRGLELLLGTVCTEIDKNEGGYRIEICNNEGINEVFAKEVIDARVPFGSTLTLLLATKDGVYPSLDCVRPAFYPDQCVVSLELEGVSDLNEAKSLVLELCEEKLAEVGARIVLTSYRMGGAPIKEAYRDEKGILHIDERAFGDIFGAYAKGGSL